MNAYTVLDDRLKAHQDNMGATFRHEEIDLIRDDKARPIWNMANAMKLLTEHSDWRDVLAFNEFTTRRVLLRALAYLQGR